jgi:hypothetical protein
MVGFRHKTADGDHEYLIPKAAFRREFKTLGGPATVMRALFDQGLAKAANARAGKFQVKRQLRPGLRMRVDCVSAAILKR